MQSVVLPAIDTPPEGIASVCCYCGTGCGVRIHVEGGRVQRVTGDVSHPSNQGKLCSKGRALAATVGDDESRVLTAQWRPAKSAERRPIALEDAFEIAAAKLAQVIERDGPDAIGFYLSGQLLTEDYTVFNKLARGLVGTNNIDTNSRLCMSSAVMGYKLTLGADAPPACYEDLDHADMVLIAGSNMAYAHPVLYQRLVAAKARRPELKVVVVDPRRTDTCAIADLHLAIAPGTDVALFHAMLNVLIWEELLDRAYIDQHTEGFAALKQRVHEFTPSAAEGICGVPAADIIQCARWFGQARAALSLYTMGLNQSSSGTDKNAALIHLHLATGKIGKPGSGPFSLTGQPNAMGGRESGGMATLLPGHRDPRDPAHRADVAALWGVPSLPETPGLPALDMFDAVLDGRIKVLWIAATNPAQSLPNQAKVRAALEKAEMVIVQEAFAGTETLDYADLVLPAATWPEKEGTVTNSERRISRVRAAIAPPGQAQADWKLACGIARRLAARLAPEKSRLFDYQDEAAIFADQARATAGRDLDYSALNYERLEDEGPRQWPYGQAGQGKARLYEDGVFPTPSGRARFLDIGYTPVAESVSALYSIQLTTGRLRDQWHTMSRSGLAAALTRHAELPQLHLHPSDMLRFGLVGNRLAKVRSRRGQLVLPAVADDALIPGHGYIPMHWGSSFIAGEGVNALSNDVCDPISFQPELKHSAVKVEAVSYEWHAAAWVQGSIPLLRRRLRRWLTVFPYAVIVPTATGGEGVRLHLAALEHPEQAVLEQLISAVGLDNADMAFDDPSRGRVRRIRREGERLKAFLLAGDTKAQDALLHWADTGTPPASASLVLVGRGPAVTRAKIVCTCENVNDQQIHQAIASGQDLAAMQANLKCGTGCGSCLPQIKQMIQRINTTERAA